MLKCRESHWLTQCVIAGLAVTGMCTADEPAGKPDSSQTDSAQADKVSSGTSVSVQSGSVQVEAGPVKVKAGEKKTEDRGSEKTTEVKAGPVSVRVHTHSSSESGPSGESRRIVSGRVVVIGPDGKTREFDLSQGIPNGLKIVGDAAAAGTGRGTFSLNIGDGKGRITANVDGGSVVIQKGEGEAAWGKDDALASKTQAQAPEAERLMLGVHCKEADPLLRSQLKLGEQGLIVMDVVEDSPAAAAGLQKHDLLLKAGDKQLKLIPDLLDAVQQNGEKELALQVLRHGDPLTLTATPKLIKEPKQVIVTLGTGDKDEEIFKWLGEGKIPPELQKHLRDHQVQLHLRHIHPGVIVEKGSSSEDIQRLLEKALKSGEAEEGTAVKGAEKSSEDKSSDRVVDKLDELSRQLQMLSERLSRLEEKK